MQRNLKEKVAVLQNDTANIRERTLCMFILKLNWSGVMKNTQFTVQEMRGNC